MSSSDAVAVPLDLLAPLMSDIERRLRRYCYLPSPEAYVAVTAWIVATYVVDLLTTAPGLVITCPLGLSAKSRLIQVVSALAGRSFVTTGANASPESLCRQMSVPLAPPTVFIDDADVLFRRGARGTKVDLRTLINSCHTRGLFGMTWDGGEVSKPFAVVCLLGVDRMPAEVEDRAVVIRMERGGESQEPGWLRRRDIGELASIANVLSLWADQNVKEISEFIRAWVERPAAESSSRMKDHAVETWEPLFAIADLAGPAWLERVIEAAESLDRQYQEEKLELSTNERLLRDIGRAVVGYEGFIGSSELTEFLSYDEEAGWGASGLTPTRLARTLRTLGIESRRDRSGRKRGFQIEELLRLVARHSDGSDVLDGSDTLKNDHSFSRAPSPERTKSA